MKQITITLGQDIQTFLNLKGIEIELNTSDENQRDEFLRFLSVFDDISFYDTQSLNWMF